MSTSDYKSVRVPVIPLDYNSRFLAEKKEILFDYNTRQLYVVSAEDKNVIFNITDVVLEKVKEGIDLDNLIINVEGIGDVNLSEYIEYLNKYNITLFDNDSKQYYAPTVKFDNMSIILCDGEATVAGFKHAGNGTYAVKQDNLIKWVPIPDRLNVPTQAITDNSTKVANTAFVQSVVSQLVNSAPETLDTLNELSSALGNDPNFATTISNMIGQKEDITEVNNKIALHNTDASSHEDIRHMFNDYVTQEESIKVIESAESAARSVTETAIEQVERFYRAMRYDIVGPTPEYMTIANLIVGAGPAAMASN